MSTDKAVRPVVWVALLALCLGVAGYFWWGQHVTDRCQAIAYQSLSSMPSPTDRDWYAEHCRR